MTALEDRSGAETANALGMKVATVFVARSKVQKLLQEERSQLQNRARAMQVLRARLLKLAQDEQQAAMSVERRAQVGGGGRGEKIRTYNFKENRVSDHRIGLTLYKLDQVLAGDLDELVDALLADERARQLEDGEP